MPPPDSGGYVVDEISKEERYRRMQQAAKQRVMTQCRQKGRGGGGALSISVEHHEEDGHAGPFVLGQTCYTRLLKWYTQEASFERRE